MIVFFKKLKEKATKRNDKQYFTNAEGNSVTLAYPATGSLPRRWTGTYVDTHHDRNVNLFMLIFVIAVFVN